MTLGTTDISIMMVRNILGYPSTDLGTLCSLGEEYINKWSKYKPVRYNFTTSRPSDWWTAQDGACGLNYKEYTSTAAMISDLRNGVTFWQYQPPRGGSSEPFRLGDFAGYSSDARNPIQCLDIMTPIYKDVYTVFGVAMEKLSVDTSYNLQLTDLQKKHDLNSFYPAVVVVRTDQSDGSLITATTTLSASEGEGIDVPTSSLSSDYSYNVIYCLSSIKQTSLAPVTTTGTFIPVPATNAMQIVEIKTGGITVSVVGEWTSAKTTYTITAYNKATTSTAVMTNVGLYIVYADFGIDRKEMIAGETFLNLSNISVPYNQTVTVTGSATKVLPNIAAKDGKLILQYTYPTGVVNKLTYEMGISN